MEVLMNNVIKLNNGEIRIIEWNGERVVSTKDIAKLHGLDVKVINRKYRRNKKYFMKEVDYYEVTKDDLTGDKNGTGGVIREMLHRNSAEYILLITESGYLNFVKTINDDIAWGIWKQLKEIYFQVKSGQMKQLRDKSKKVRNHFTEMLSDRGYTKQNEYIQTTKQMKKALDITSKKDQMSDIELQKVMMAEILSDIRIADTSNYGYYEVNPVCVEASEDTKGLIDKRKDQYLLAE
jgi:hypothetical protein